jgi:hypothetical protein
MNKITHMMVQTMLGSYPVWPVRTIISVKHRLTNIDRNPSYNYINPLSIHVLLGWTQMLKPSKTQLREPTSKKKKNMLCFAAYQNLSVCKALHLKPNDALHPAGVWAVV